MSIYDRDYSRPDYEQQRPQMQFRFPQVTPVVKNLLILNIGIYLACIIIKPLGNFVYTWFSVDSRSLSSSLQIWRLVGYQFLHDQSTVTHLLFNMMGLYFLGPTLERFWHSKKFLIFYLVCGSVGGISYILLSRLGIVGAGVLVGASGAILGMLAACAILFPQFVVFIFIFPVPIRVASALFMMLYIINIFTGGPNAGGDAAHLAGMIVGGGYVYLWPRLKNRYRPAIHSDNWEVRFKAYSEIQREVDRILEKVAKQGIGSLSKQEKKTLAEATKLEQMKSGL
jgi:membrane associated rhomboid family serine protease